VWKYLCVYDDIHSVTILTIHYFWWLFLLLILSIYCLQVHYSIINIDISIILHYSIAIVPYCIVIFFFIPKYSSHSIIVYLVFSIHRIIIVSWLKKWFVFLGTIVGDDIWPILTIDLFILMTIYSIRDQVLFYWLRLFLTMPSSEADVYPIHSDTFLVTVPGDLLLADPYWFILQYYLSVIFNKYLFVLLTGIVSWYLFDPSYLFIHSIPFGSIPFYWLIDIVPFST